MKKILLTALAVLCIAPFFTCHASAEELASSAADMTGVREAESAVPDDARDISGTIEPDGTYDAAGALERLWRRIINDAAEELRGNVQSAAALVAIAM